MNYQIYWRKIQNTATFFAIFQLKNRCEGPGSFLFACVSHHSFATTTGMVCASSKIITLFARWCNFLLAHPIRFLRTGRRMVYRDRAACKLALERRTVFADIVQHSSQICLLFCAERRRERSSILQMFKHCLKTGPSSLICAKKISYSIAAFFQRNSGWRIY